MTDRHNHPKLINCRSAATGASPFGRWFSELNAPAAAKVTTAIARLEQGNTSTLKGVGGGVVELRIDFGPGLVERFFARLKQFRRIATRYEKLARNFNAMLNLTCAYIWLV